MNLPGQLVEAHPTINQGEQRPIPAGSYVLTRMEFRAILADDDASSGDELGAKGFDAEPFARAIATVPGASLSFLVSHKIYRFGETDV